PLARVTPSVEALEPRWMPASVQLAPFAVGLPTFAGGPRLLVKFRPGVESFAGLPPGARVGPAVALVPGLHTVTLARGTPVDRAIAAFRARSDVLSVEPDARIHLTRTGNDPLTAGQWPLQAGAGLNLPAAWEATVGTRSTVVAVID